jgi:hypothetical protein
MKTFFAFTLSLIAVCVFAQSPTPPMIVVQAANAAATPAATPVVAQDPTALRPTLQTLEQMKAANADTLKRQEALLQQLDELQKAADQIKIFSHRTGG